MNWKGYGRKRSWSNIRYLPRVTKETHKKAQDCRSPDWNLIPSPPECESEVLITQSQRSVKSFKIKLFSEWIWNDSVIRRKVVKYLICYYNCILLANTKENME
jgi:hypothetical protein